MRISPEVQKSVQQIADQKKTQTTITPLTSVSAYTSTTTTTATQLHEQHMRRNIGISPPHTSTSKQTTGHSVNYSPAA